MALLLPCLFAAFRAETVGTDVLHYVKPYYLSALSYDSLTGYLAQGSAEIGYEIFIYYIAKIFGCFQSILFFIELLVIIPVYIVSLKNKKRWSVWISMAVYYAVFYIPSFNFMRQSIAAALLLLAFFELIEEKWLKTLLLVIIAQMFHSTAIIGASIILFGTLFYRIKSKNYRTIVFVLVSTLLVGVFVDWKNIIYWAVNSIGILPLRFMSYVAIFSGERNQSSYYFTLTKSNYIELLFRWLCFLLPFYFGKKIHKSDRFYDITKIIILLSTVVYTGLFLLFHTSYGVRITWYMEYFYIIWIPMGYTNIKNTRRRLGVMPRNTFATCLLLLMYWVCGFMILGWHGTLPFSFSF